jgi:hypothetical protein
MSQSMTQQPYNRVAAMNELQDTHLDAGFTINAETANAITVNIAVKTNRGQTAIASRRALMCYLSDASTGAGVTATAPATSVVAGTNGKVDALVTKKVFLCTTNASGALDIVLTETGVATWYLVVVMPDGRLVVSSDITFA